MQPDLPDPDDLDNEIARLGERTKPVDVFEGMMRHKPPRRPDQNNGISVISVILCIAGGVVAITGLFGSTFLLLGGLMILGLGVIIRLLAQIASNPPK